MTLPTEGQAGHLQKHADIDTTLAANAASIAAGDVTNPASAAGIALSATFAIANPALTVTYNGDGSVASTTENGVVTTFTYNGDGTVATQTRAGVTKTFSYGAYGVTGAI